MNINENIRNERKLADGYIYIITTTPAAKYLILQDLVPNKS